MCGRQANKPTHCQIQAHKHSSPCRRSSRASIDNAPSTPAAPSHATSIGVWFTECRNASTLLGAPPPTAPPPRNVSFSLSRSRSRRPTLACPSPSPVPNG
jgi:hypothetical protein